MGWQFVVVPQWQGSGSSRAMRLIDGAEAIRGDLPSARTIEVPVPGGAGDSLGTGVHRLSSIVAVRDATRQALEAIPADDLPLIIGGDCGVELATVEHAAAAHPDLALVWFDAHADLNTPDSSPSHAFHGMILRTLLGDGEEVLIPEAPLSPARTLLVGTRALDDAEADFVDSSGLVRIAPGDLDPTSLVEAVEATGARSVYIHVDLDVLDPEAVTGVGYPEPFGLALDALVAAIGALRDRFELVGAGITEFAPATPAAAEEDLPTILRVLSAITSRR
ncbi:MAG: arginase family protein [Naasia sp.]